MICHDVCLTPPENEVIQSRVISLISVINEITKVFVSANLFDYFTTLNNV